MIKMNSRTPPLKEKKVDRYRTGKVKITKPADPEKLKAYLEEQKKFRQTVSQKRFNYWH